MEAFELDEPGSDIVILDRRTYEQQKDCFPYQGMEVVAIIPVEDRLEARPATDEQRSYNGSVTHAARPYEPPATVASFAVVLRTCRDDVVRNLRTEIDDLQSEKFTAEAQLRNLQAEHDTLADSLRETTAALEETQATCAGQVAQLASRDQDLKGGNATIRDLQKELNKARRHFGDAAWTAAGLGQIKK